MARVEERCEQKFMHMCRQLLIGYMQATQTRHARKNVHRSLPALAGVVTGVEDILNDNTTNVLVG
jgi:hypothetical protein